MNALILALLTTYFQQDCRPCRRQLKEFDCFARQGWSLAAVGIGDNPLALRHEFRRQTLAASSLTFISWQEARKKGITATPISVIEIKGEKPRLVVGFVPCDA